MGSIEWGAVLCLKTLQTIACGGISAKEASLIRCFCQFKGEKMPDTCKRKRNWLESALDEGNKLLACSAQERLEMCYLSKKGTVKKLEGETGTLLCSKPMKTWTKISNKKSNYRVGRKKKGGIICSLEAAGSEDILSAEDLVLSETEIILKDLDQILEHVAASSKPAFESFVAREDNNVKEQVSNCCMAFTAKGPMEINTQEDCIIIDGKAFKAGECIESITDRFKEIDSLMAEFQDSL